MVYPPQNERGKAARKKGNYDGQRHGGRLLSLLDSALDKAFKRLFRGVENHIQHGFVLVVVEHVFDCAAVRLEKAERAVRRVQKQLLVV